MAASTVKKTTLQQDANKVVVLINIEADGDGTELSSSLVADISGYTVGATPSEVKIVGVKASLEGFVATLEWDAAANTVALVLSGSVNLSKDDLGGGIVNDSSTGKTGDIDLTTTLMDAGEGGYILLTLEKL